MTKRTTIEEVFAFIDDAHIKTIDALELKSRIADMVKGERENAVDEFAENIIKRLEEKAGRNDKRKNA